MHKHQTIKLLYLKIQKYEKTTENWPTVTKKYLRIYYLFHNKHNNVIVDTTWSWVIN